MVTYAQTNATTISHTSLNNAFTEEVANAKTAWMSKYRHLWRVNLVFENLDSGDSQFYSARWFYAPDDMMLVALTLDGRGNGTTPTVTVTLSGDTEMIGSASSASISGALGAGYNPVTRTSFDAPTDDKFFIRKGALYVIKATTTGTNASGCASAVFAVQKRPF